MIYFYRNYLLVLGSIIYLFFVFNLNIFQFLFSAVNEDEKKAKAEENKSSNQDNDIEELEKVKSDKSSLDVEKIENEAEREARNEIEEEKRLRDKRVVKKNEDRVIWKLSDVKVIAWYSIHRKTLDFVPETYEQLKEEIKNNIISSWDRPVSEDEFDMYFFHYDGEKWSIDSQEDLECVYKMAVKATPPFLKVLIEIERNRGTKKNQIKYKRRANKKYKEFDSDFESCSDEEDKWFEEKFTFKDQECEFLNLIREGIEYKNRQPFGDRLRKGHLVSKYIWTTPKCTGAWEWMPLMFNGEYGRLLINHSIPLSEHGKNAENELLDKFSKALLSNEWMINDYLPKEHVKKLVYMLCKNDPNLTATEILIMIKRTFPNAEVLNRGLIDGLLSAARGNSSKSNIGSSSVDIKKILTFRKTEFGRGFCFSLINNEKRYFTYFYSDFQEKVINEVKNDPNLHIFLDGTFKCWPQIWNQLLNIWVLHRGKQLYIPVAHILMQSNKYEAYRIALSWFTNVFNLNPKFVTIDFEPALMNAAKEFFPNSHMVPCFWKIFSLLNRGIKINIV